MEGSLTAPCGWRGLGHDDGLARACSGRGGHLRSKPFIGVLIGHVGDVVVAEIEDIGRQLHTDAVALTQARVYPDHCIAGHMYIPPLTLICWPVM
jgi:hypothetical protein